MTVQTHAPISAAGFVDHLMHNVLWHFRLRSVSWIMTLAILWTGLILLLNSHSYGGDVDPYKFAYLERFASREFVAIYCIVLGCLRACSLLVTGNSIWALLSPIYQAIASLLCALIWFQIALGFFAEPRLNPALAVYAVLVLFEMLSTYGAIYEAEYRKG